MFTEELGPDAEVRLVSRERGATGQRIIHIMGRVGIERIGIMLLKQQNTYLYNWQSCKEL